LNSRLASNSGPISKLELRFGLLCVSDNLREISNTDSVIANGRVNV